MDVRVFSAETAAEGRRRRRTSASISARRCRRASSSRRTDASSTAPPTSPASPTCSATRSRPGETEAVSNTETGFFRPIPARRRPAGRVPLHRAGPAARRASPARRSRTPRRSRSSASGSPRKSRSCARGSPGRRRTSRGRRCRRRTASTGWPADCKSESFYPDRPGLQGLGGRRHAMEPVGSAAAQSPEPVGQLQPRHGPGLRASACTCARTTSATTGGPRPCSTTPTSTTCSARPRPDARATASSVGRKWTLLYDDPRRLELDVEGAYSGNLDRLPGLPERAGGRRRPGHASTRR